MFNRKAHRIADLEARNTYLVEQLEQARQQPSTDTTDRLRAELRQARGALRTAESRLSVVRRENVERTGRMVAYSNQAVSNLRRLARAVRACARYRAELATQRAVTDRLTEQLFDALGYDEDLRARLAYLPAADAVVGEVTR